MIFFWYNRAPNMEASSRFLNSELINRHKAGLNGQLVEKDRDNLFKSIAENLKHE